MKRILILKRDDVEATLFKCIYVSARNVLKERLVCFKFYCYEVFRVER